jgi:hypothetical protein
VPSQRRLASLFAHWKSLKGTRNYSIQEENGHVFDILQFWRDEWNGQGLKGEGPHELGSQRFLEAPSPSARIGNIVWFSWLVLGSASTGVMIDSGLPKPSQSMGDVTDGSISVAVVDRCLGLDLKGQVKSDAAGHDDRVERAILHSFGPSQKVTTTLLKPVGRMAARVVDHVLLVETTLPQGRRH